MNNQWVAKLPELSDLLICIAQACAMHPAGGLLLPIWDKLPGDYVRVPRIAARDGRSLLVCEIGVGDSLCWRMRLAKISISL